VKFSEKYDNIIITFKVPQSMNTVPTAFPGRLLSRFGDIQWPSNSPDLTAADFLWGYLEARVFTHTLPDINSLKNAIRQEIANVTQDTTSRHGKCTWEMAAMP
jgi:hypothetical protein